LWDFHHILWSMLFVDRWPTLRSTNANCTSLTHLWSTLIDKCNVVPTLIDKCKLHVIDSAESQHNKHTENTFLWLTHTRTHTDTSVHHAGPIHPWSNHRWCGLSMQLHCQHWHLHTIMHAHKLCEWPYQQVHMWLTCTPTNALHVRCMFVQLTWCELRCNQFDHWDIHAWCCYYTFYMWCIIDAAIYLTAICDVSSILQRNARPQHENIENTLLDHSTRT